MGELSATVSSTSSFSSWGTIGSLQHSSNISPKGRTRDWSRWRSPEELELWLGFFAPLSEDVFTSRHDPVQPIEPIAGEDTFYLGYIVERELARRLQENPADAEASGVEERRREIVRVGIRNHEAYLTSDHLDVYVATSMRERHEYLLVADLTEKIFSNDKLSSLKPRWFDPRPTAMIGSTRVCQKP